MSKASPLAEYVTICSSTWTSWAFLLSDSKVPSHLCTPLEIFTQVRSCPLNVAPLNPMRCSRISWSNSVMRSHALQHYCRCIVASVLPYPFWAEIHEIPELKLLGKILRHRKEIFEITIHKLQAQFSSAFLSLPSTTSTGQDNWRQSCHFTDMAKLRPEEKALPCLQSSALKWNQLCLADLSVSLFVFFDSHWWERQKTVPAHKTLFLICLMVREWIWPLPCSAR